MKLLRRLCLLAALLVVAAGSITTVNLGPGDLARINCANSVFGITQAAGQLSVSCATNTPRPSPTVTATDTQTPTATTTQTATPTTTATQPPTATAVPSVLAAVNPLILGTCTAAVHDRYTVTAQDGKLYRTWHPQVVPVDPANSSLGTCAFAHEHGDDPTTSIANDTLPPFGYIGAQINDIEPHEGFKVFVVNVGTVNNDSYTALNSTRFILHQGTGGVKRFDTKLHSLRFDLVGPLGDVHIQGMADTGSVGSICANPRQGKTVMELPSNCTTTSLYEIWAASLTVGNRATVNIAAGVFDPITVLDPASPVGARSKLYSRDIYPQYGDKYGCKREGYSGPVYLSNAGGPSNFYTDAYGNLAISGLLQQVTAVNVAPPGIPMARGNPYQMKAGSDSCAPGLGLLN